MLRKWFIAGLVAFAAAGGTPFEFWPGCQYDARIPTFREVLGYDPGEQITSPGDILRYLEALAARSGRLRIFEYARSWEGRKLVYVAIGSEANLRRLQDIRTETALLADPRRTPKAEAEKLIARLPATVWFAYGIHGNEVSPSDAALLTAYHLLAARNDPLVNRVLESVLVLIDPLQNPDGRERFLASFKQARGREADEDPIAAEHNEPWPDGRGNHYLIDLNRDWFAFTQPETRGAVKALLEWHPVVFVDLHEMAPESTYYFTPEAEPYNPHLAADLRSNLQILGRNNAKWFDRFGFDYFTREVYDDFYPGYGASWPLFSGSIATTYEQGSARGLAYRRADGRLLLYRDMVRRHFAAVLATAEAAAQNRERFLRSFYSYRAAAVEEGRNEPVRAYILPRGRDAAATDKLAALLARQGIEVERAEATFRAQGREYAAGTYVVPLAQPAKRLIRTLLDPDTPLDPKFIKQEEERRRRKLAGEIYDVTAWSLPLMFNVEAVASPAAVEGSFKPVSPDAILPGSIHGGAASVAYLAPWGSAAGGRLLAAALREDLVISTTDKPFSLAGAPFPGGSLIFNVHENRPDLRERLARLAHDTGADLYAANSGWVDEGVNFGSRHVVTLRRPKIALAWGPPASPASAGAARFVLEQQYGFPVTAIRTPQLADPGLNRFQVVILPGGGDYAEELGDEAIDRLSDWVKAGGTLIAIGEAVASLTNPKVGLLAVAQENAVREKTPEGENRDEEKEEKTRARGTLLLTEKDYARAVQADKELPENTPGALLRARLTADHWLTAGLGETVQALVQGRAIFTPIKLDKGVNAAFFEGPDRIRAGGFLWEESRKQHAYKPLIIIQPQDRGMVIGFTADPNYRAYLDGMNLLFLNAVFRGPAHRRQSIGR